MIDVRIDTRADGPLAVLPDLEAVGPPLRRAAAELARASTEPRITVDVAGLTAGDVAEGVVLGGYREGTPGTLRSVTLLGVDDPAAVGAGVQRAQAVCWARDLTNARAMTKTPAWLARQAAQVLTPLGVRVEVRDETWLAEHGFGGVLAVAGGSVRPPRMVEAAWGPRRAARHVVLVGKGITFDTGGLNIKTGGTMRQMYTDMGGGAAVLGAVRAIAAQRLPVRVTVLVPMAENAVSGSAYRPSDVVRHYGGRTTEVLNTDAEGRMVLADALAYAVDRLRPTELVDLATLTGAMKLSLGLGIAGMLSTSDTLAADLAQAAVRADEAVWRLPMVAEYEQLIESTVADANNAPGNPGGIAAAHFLRPFTGGLPWAHLDIAGPARSSVDRGVLAKGATGFGVSLLTRWLS